jgi:exopolyphosphatase / guanosine-5'-triphosphate,3'-diphosphate pyrophosphatase
MTIASIDIGTNTILLLIAETDSSSKHIKMIRDELRMPRIGRGLLANSPIRQEKAELLLKTLSEYKKIIAQYSCEKVILTATNAFRIASNANELVKKVKSDLDMDITVVAGKDEAGLSYLGAVSSFPGEDKYLVIDIGGGSTEIISGNKTGILFSNSYQVGVVSLTERFFKSRKPETAEIKQFTDFVKQSFSGIDCNKFTPAKTIAIAGTPTTLACIKQNLKDYDESVIEGSTLTMDETNAFTGMLSALTPDEIKAKFGNVMSGREDVIFAGTCILHTFMECFNVPELTVSTKGIRYGAIINYLANKS